MLSDNPNPVTVSDKNMGILINSLKDIDLSELSFGEILEIEQLIKMNISQIKGRHGLTANTGVNLKVAEQRTKISHDKKE